MKIKYIALLVCLLLLPSLALADVTGCTTSGVVVEEGVVGGCSGNYGRESGVSSIGSGVFRAHLTRVQVNCSESAAGGTISGTFQDSLNDGRTILFGIYSDNAGEPDARLWVSSDELFNAGSEASFELITDTFSGVTFVSGSYYWIGFLTESDDTDLEYTASSGTARYDTIASYAWPATWDTGGDSHSTAEKVTWITF